MVANCRICECPLDDYDVAAAGMDNICAHCWEKEYEESK